MFKFIKQKNKKQENSRDKFSSLPTKQGFSLVELVLVIFIMTMITSVILASHGRFSGSISLENLAYEVALTVRQAQFFGMNVREVSLGSGEFGAGYGVYFDKSNPTSFIFFADINNNKLYDGAGELLEIYNMTRGNNIKYLCVDGGCNNPASSLVDEIYAVFRRPDPDAIIKTGNSSDCGMAPTSSCGLAKIVLSSPNTDIPDRIISMTSTGQISITN